MPPGFSLLRPAWMKLNHLCTSKGLFCSETHKWNMASTAAISVKKQIAEHIATFCTIYHHPNGACALSDVNKNLATWLKETFLAI